jgi:hypothetical protein
MRIGRMDADRKQVKNFLELNNVAAKQAPGPSASSPMFSDLRKSAAAAFSRVPFPSP